MSIDQDLVPATDLRELEVRNARAVPKRRT